MASSITGGLHDVIITRLHGLVQTNSAHDELRSDELLVILERGVSDVPASDLERLANQLDHIRLHAARDKTKKRLAEIAKKLRQRHHDVVR